MRSFETLETERLILRKLSPDDIKYLFANFDQPYLMTFFGLETEEEFEIEKSRNEGGYTTHNRSICMFQLIEKSKREVIGSCSYHNWYTIHKRSEIGYHLRNDSYKNKGYMKEALGAIIQYGFNVLNLNRIEAFVGTNNTPSLRLMQHYKFTREGVLKQHFYINNKFEDSAVFALFKADYEA
jgi:ribosomal-protein-alanine N-acetyltransferase